jgi:hypothetical protein
LISNHFCVFVPYGIAVLDNQTGAETAWLPHYQKRKWLEPPEHSLPDMENDTLGIF